MKEFKNKREQVEAEFISFMEQTIWNCARNATRKAYAAEERNSGLSLDALDERSYMPPGIRPGYHIEKVIDPFF